jgi:hypothetical protein
MEDVERAYKLLDKTAGELGLFEADRKKASDLLKDYGDKRENLLNAMVALLEKSDESSLEEDWKECSSNGKEALSTLNDAVPPEGGEGLAGIGLDAFYRGELKSWNENAKGAIALAAQEMDTIHLIHATLIEDCKQQVETIKDDDKVIQEAVRGIFPSITDSLKTVAVIVAKIVWKKEGPGAPIDQYVSFFAKDFMQTLEQARKRGALKRKLLGYIGQIEDTKEKMGDWKIDETFEDAKKGIGSLQDGRDGDYEARDWIDFGDRCREALEKKRDDAKNRSQELFEGLYPVLRQQIEKDFKTLYFDPDKLEAWNNEIDQQFENIDSAIDAQDSIVESLADGPVKQAAMQTLRTIRDIIKVSIDQFKELSEQSQKEMDEK